MDKKPEKKVPGKWKMKAPQPKAQPEPAPEEQEQEDRAEDQAAQPPKRVNNTLSGKERHQLWEFLKENTESIQERKPSVQQVADEMTVLMGRKITRGNINGARESGVIDWEVPHGNDGTGVKARMTTLEKEVAALGLRLANAETERTSLLEGMKHLEAAFKKSVQEQSRRNGPHGRPLQKVQVEEEEEDEEDDDEEPDYFGGRP